MILLGNLERGGAEGVACELVRRWSADGIACTVASMRGGGPMGAAFTAAGAAVHEGLAPRRWSAGWARVARLMRRVKCDSLIVVDPLRNGLFHGLVGARLAGGAATICWCHSSPQGQGGRFVSRLRAYGGLGLLDLVVCVSEHQRRELAWAGLDSPAMEVVPNGVDLAGLAAGAGQGRRQGSPKVVLCVANAMPDKDFATLADAWGRLAKRRGGVELVLAGRGTELVAGRYFADSRLPVRALGQRDDVPALLGSADVLVLSSRSETFGLAVLEAMAAGVPVVASDLPAIRELTGEEAALLVAPGHAGAMAAALERVLADERLAGQLRRAGLDRASLYDSTLMADRMRQLAESLIAGRAT